MTVELQNGINANIAPEKKYVLDFIAGIKCESGNLVFTL
jgi:hypothetical protein